jgi:ATP-dependent RNA helicase RhlE
VLPYSEVFMSFGTFGLHPTLLGAIHTLGYIDPTPIQKAAIPAILTGRDLIGCAQTGTGKTAAYLLPLLHRLLHDAARGPRVLIVLPTRELAVQVDAHRRELTSHTALRGTVIHGGVPFAPQAHALRANVDVVAATPGRLLDHLARHSAWCARVQVLVLDEADRMLDMGFLPDLRKILSYLPQPHQTLLFSATLPPAIAALAEEMLRAPQTVAVGSQSAPPARLAHTVYPVSPPHKTALLLALLARPSMGGVLVFTRTKHRADRLTHALNGAGFRVTCLHGDRTQHQRLQALEGFRCGTHQIMVATDIAARGLDIERISHVVNYDVPGCPEDYVHRVGRTARAGAEGEALTLMTPAETDQMHGIERWLGRTLPLEVWPEFTDTVLTAAPVSSGGPRRASSTVRHFRPRRRTAMPRSGR